MVNKFPKFKKLAPILYVSDLQKEKAFYLGLGFELSYEGDEFPGFIGIKSGDIEFGLEEKQGFDPESAIFYWQFEVESLKAIVELCQRTKVPYEGPKKYWERMDAWEMTIKTPNGYNLHLEGPNPSKV